MSTAYELTGRRQQKTRTRNALVAAARELLAEGRVPTVEEAADRAEVSRSTAYRYFPNQRLMLIATYPDIARTSLLDEPAPEDPVERLDIVVGRITDSVLKHEPEARTQLRLALTPHTGEDQLPFRRGRAIGWIEDALAPLRERMNDADLRRLVLAIRATSGIEALVWLTDVAGVSRQEAVDIMRSSARTLLLAALHKLPPEAGG